MKLPQIINSLLEQDLYKVNMGQCIFHQFSDYTTTWTFKCRNEDVFFTPEMVGEIKKQIQSYCKLRFTEDELNYLKSLKWIKSSYVDFLRLWHPRYEDFTITTDAKCGLAITVDGSWLNSSMVEVPVLAIVNEVYFRMKYDYKELMKSFRENLEAKIKRIANGGDLCISNFSEFGLRRRLSGEAQEMVVEKLAKTKYGCSTFVGTSNMYLAKKYGVKPIGTQAHEYFLAQQGNQKYNPAYSNFFALSSWVKEYGVLNGIALTDTITTDCFLLDFDHYMASIFSGVRHDSGCPIQWGEKMIKHYESLGIDAKTKTLLFSDSLNFKEADRIFRHFQGRAIISFGIGTFLSNDTGDLAKPLNIVMKPTSFNEMACAKLSDVDGKNMCQDPEYINYLKRCIKWRMEHEK